MKKIGNDVPEIVNMDELAVMDDDVLYECLRALDVGRRSNKNVDAWATEMAYIQRELQIRVVQHDTHIAWLSSGGNVATVDPEAEFDDA